MFKFKTGHKINIGTWLKPAPFLLSCFIFFLSAPIWAQPPTSLALIALAPASLTDVASDLGAAFEAKTEYEIQFSFAATSQNAQLMARGAPAAFFLSAHPKWMTYLLDQGHLDPATVHTLARTDLVMITAQDNSVIPEPEPGQTLQQIISLSRLIGLATPDAVPAGLYAQEALKSLGLWDATAGKRIALQNVRTVVTTTARRDVTTGIVYATDAQRFADTVRVVSVFPAHSHSPVTYQVGRAPDVDDIGFVSFMTSPAAQAVFSKHGFRHVD